MSEGYHCITVSSALYFNSCSSAKAKEDKRVLPLSIKRKSIVHKKKEQQTVRWQISSYNINYIYSCKFLVLKIKYCSKLDGEDLHLKCTDSASFLLAETTVSIILFDLMQKTVSTKDRNSFNTIILQLFLLSTGLHESYAFYIGGISKEIYNCSGKFWGSKF